MYRYLDRYRHGIVSKLLTNEHAYWHRNVLKPAIGDKTNDPTCVTKSSAAEYYVIDRQGQLGVFNDAEGTMGADSNRTDERRRLVQENTIL